MRNQISTHVEKKKGSRGKRRYGRLAAIVLAVLIALSVMMPLNTSALAGIAQNSLALNGTTGIEMYFDNSVPSVKLVSLPMVTEPATATTNAYYVKRPGTPSGSYTMDVMPGMQAELLNVNPNGDPNPAKMINFIAWRTAAPNYASTYQSVWKKYLGITNSTDLTALVSGTVNQTIRDFIVAAQAAIWHYTLGYNFSTTGNTAKSVEFYNKFIAMVDANPDWTPMIDVNMTLNDSGVSIINDGGSRYYGPLVVSASARVQNYTSPTSGGWKIPTNQNLSDIYLEVVDSTSTAFELYQRQGSSYVVLGKNEKFGSGEDHYHIAGTQSSTSKTATFYIKLPEGFTDVDDFSVLASAHVKSTSSTNLEETVVLVKSTAQGNPASNYATDPLLAVLCACNAQAYAEKYIKLPRTARIRFEGLKSVSSGATIPEDEFTFSLYEISEATYDAKNFTRPSTAPKATGEVVDTATGKIEFTPISYPSAGTYFYAIVEDPVDLPGWTGDSDVIYKKVEVSGPVGALIAEDMTSNDYISFTNTYEDTPIYDAALRKWVKNVERGGMFVSTEPYPEPTSGATPPVAVQKGDKIVFAIKLINQGRNAVTIPKVSDYMPAGYTFDLDDQTDANWLLDGDTGNPVYNEQITLTTSGNTATHTLELILTVSDGATANNLDNYAEISKMIVPGTDNIDAPDIDSTPDSISLNDGSVKDNIISENGKRNGDEDDHDIARVTLEDEPPAPEYDAALQKWVVSVNDELVDEDGEADTVPNTLTPAVKAGDKVRFAIRVFNQGTTDLIITDISDYLPTGFTFNPADQDDAGWEADGTRIKYITPIPLAGSAPTVGDNFEIIYITLTVKASGNLKNFAEISVFTDGEGTGGLEDKDSTPNAEPYDDGTAKDNVINEDHKTTPSDDEDDHDFAEVVWENPPEPEYDAALRKWVVAVNNNLVNAAAANTPNTLTPEVETGNKVRFAIQIINQESTEVKITDISDYLPAGFEFLAADQSDVGWAVDGARIKYTTPIDLTGGASKIIYITLTVKASGSLENFAEISEMKDKDGKDVVIDKDSETDSSSTNDGTPKDNVINENRKANPNDDEDDHDFAKVLRKNPLAPVYDAALRKWVVAVNDTLVNAAAATTPNTLVPTVATGDKVRFAIQVFNQGTTNLVISDISDYLPAGFEFIAADQSDNGWAVDGTRIKYSTPIALAGSAPTASDNFKIIYITLRVKASGSLKNLAEIFEMKNDEGLVVEDKDSVGDKDPNNDTAKDNVIDEDGKANKSNDEDDHDFAEVKRDNVPNPVYDAALQKWVVAVNNSLVNAAAETTPNTLTPTVKTGDKVRFAVKAINQGTTKIVITDISDYLPAGYAFTAADQSDNGWAVDGARIKYTTPITLDGGASKTIYITLTVNASGSLRNLAEISEMKDEDGKVVEDKDSTVDKNSDNDTVKDNEINEDGKANKANDEDDHDIAETKRETTPPQDPEYDAALQKWIVAVNNTLVNSAAETTPNTLAPVVKTGDKVRFAVKVINQGTTKVVVTDISDYLPAGFSFSAANQSDNGWAVDGARIKYTTPITLAGGASKIIYITLTVNASGSLRNLAEISEMKDEDGKVVEDKDSVGDKNSSNDTAKDNVINEDGKANKSNDEDDHDFAEASRQTVVENPPATINNPTTNTNTDTNTGKGKTGTNTQPKTGDDMTVGMYILLLGLSMAGMGMLFFSLKRRSISRKVSR